MDELLGKLLKLKTSGKIGVTAAVAAIIVLGYNTLFYADLADQLASTKGRQGALREELLSYERRKVEYLAYRNELNQLQEQQRALLRALPKQQEIPSFIGSIQEQAELAGLEVLNLSIDSEIPEELYVKIPVDMQVRGGYHNVTRFFRSVSELRRIVNVENLQLKPETLAKGETGPVKLRARFTAATFRYDDAQGGS